MLSRHSITKKAASLFPTNIAWSRRVVKPATRHQWSGIRFDRLQFALNRRLGAQGLHYLPYSSTILSSQLHLRTVMTTSPPSAALSEFLQTQKTQYLKAIEEGKAKEWTVVTGNEAGGMYCATPFHTDEYF